ncbi:MAG: hypothetical protein KBB11_00625 [Bacteroidales bacterium]|nr:hypothetical protein [Bacteroidales bacterium]HOY38062.1 hypothetical protein [Bacteroidales bacterium]HQP03611.1 hypothetical protein [Bacteroidales bacterium]
MKLKAISASVILIFLITLSLKSEAQSVSEWLPVGLSVSGNNIQKNVEALYGVSVCNGVDVILLKFINNNEYEVRVEWTNGIFTDQGEWVTDPLRTELNSIVIPEGSEVFGDCENAAGSLLLVKISDFLSVPGSLNKYRALEFHVYTD